MGIDLAELWGKRRWRKLWNIIQSLPRASYYVQAISLDEEVAEAALNSKQPPPEPGLEMSEYSTVVEHLQLIHAAVSNVSAAVLAVNQVKPPRYRPLPRPHTAYQKKKSERRVKAHRSLVARVIPQQT